MKETMIIAGAMLGFPLMWVLVVRLISVIGGWNRLAGKYLASCRPPENLSSFRSARFAFWMSYNNCLKVGTTEEGLYLDVFFLFRIGHPALFIPWQDITVTAVNRLWGQVTTVSFPGNEFPTIRIYGPLEIPARVVQSQS